MNKNVPFTQDQIKKIKVGQVLQNNAPNRTRRKQLLAASDKESPNNRKETKGRVKWRIKNGQAKY